jgi:hypothetical protein
VLIARLCRLEVMVRTSNASSKFINRRDKA